MGLASTALVLISWELLKRSMDQIYDGLASPLKAAEDHV